MKPNRDVKICTESLNTMLAIEVIRYILVLKTSVGYSVLDFELISVTKMRGRTEISAVAAFFPKNQMKNRPKVRNDRARLNLRGTPLWL